VLLPAVDSAVLTALFGCFRFFDDRNTCGYASVLTRSRSPVFCRATERLIMFTAPKSRYGCTCRCDRADPRYHHDTPARCCQYGIAGLSGDCQPWLQPGSWPGIRSLFATPRGVL